MNILLWVIQVLIAFFCVSGAAWRISHYADASTKIASVGALPYAAWVAIGAFEIVAALGLILPGLLKFKPKLTVLAASALTVEMLLLSGLHLSYFGFQLAATNPATWTLAMAVLSGFVAYGRKAWKPL